MSAFENWFIAQHGPRTRCPDLSDDDLSSRIAMGKMAEAEAAKRALWDDRRTSALYAWQVKDQDKKSE